MITMKHSVTENEEKGKIDNKMLLHLTAREAVT